MAIKFEKINFTYHPSTPFEHKALFDINESINDGDFLAIVGQTGSGKSTLVQTVNALLLPQKGRILVNNYTIDNNKKKIDSISGISII